MMKHPLRRFASPPSRGAAPAVRPSRAGHWLELLNTDAERYGGSNRGNLGGVDATDTPYDDQPYSAVVTIPPLSAIWFTPDKTSSIETAEKDTGATARRSLT